LYLYENIRGINYKREYNMYNVTKVNSVEEWVNGNQLSIDIINKKYLQEGETFEEWCDRITGGNEDYKRLFIEKKFIPGGRILSNRGLDNKSIKSTMSNCYVLSVDDSIESIYDTCSKMARTYSYGGGVGIDISKLRPCGAIVKNSARTTTGAVSFMRTFDVVTGTIGQNGRRGALMISMDVSHPDVTEFINIKANTDQITNANISVRVNDKFMEAVKNDDDYILHWPCDMTISDKEINAINKYNELVMVETNCGPVYLKKIKAKELFMQLAKNNWDYGEPGILYWNRISSYHLMSENKDFEYAGVNPCAEEPLPNGGACLLGSMNLYQYVVNGLFDYKAFANDCKIATRWLNDIQKEGGELHPLQVQRDTARDYKQIGLGIFDLAGALIKMGVKYGSKQAQDVAREITKTMLIAAFEQSCDLNTEGKEYPNMFDSEFYKKQVEPYIAEQYKGRYPLNSQILTIAPTGTISTMLNATAGGGEPMFALFYIRSTKSIGETDYKVYPQCVLDYFGENEVDEEKLPDYYISSDMISPKERIEMQAALQENIDASISSTINLPEKTTVQDVYDIYMYAWESGLKGVTIFRDGCKRVAILNRTEKKNNECVFNTVNAPKRPKSLDADYYQVKVKGENFIIIVGLLDGKPYELFALPCDNCQKVKNHRGKVIRVKKREYKFESDILTIDNIAIEPGIYNINDEVSKISEIVNDGHKLNKIETDAIKDSIYKIIDWSEKREYRNVALHVSGNLRTGMRIEDIVKLEDKCADSIVSFPKAIGRVLSKYMETSELDDICPECGEKLIREGGCIHCPNCGWGKCL
jgi:ribonucleoside-diphosphate reductase alpha chain